MVGRRLLTQPQNPCANCQDGCGYVRSGEAGFEVLCKRCPGRRALLPPSRLPDVATGHRNPHICLTQAGLWASVLFKKLVDPENMAVQSLAPGDGRYWVAIRVQSSGPPNAWPFRPVETDSVARPHGCPVSLFISSAQDILWAK